LVDASMKSMARARRWSFGFSALAAIGALVALSPRTEAADAPACDALEVEYALTGTLILSDTPSGKGDGSYRVGPGTAIVRFALDRGGMAGPAKLVAYEMVERFRIDASVVFLSTHVTTAAKTTVGRDACGVVAHGNLSGNKLELTTPLRSSRTDGTVSCEGSLCGKLGAPPPGTSALHIPPHDVHFEPWVFGPDLKTFTMAETWSARSEAPKQTSHITLSGRELRRECVSFSKRPGC
jgi:hypothetical protein